MAARGGWVKVARKLLDWRWYKDANTMRVFLHLLLSANVEDHDFQHVTIHRGQVATSYESLANALGLSIQNAENMRKKILEGKKYGLTEGEYLLYELALKMVDQPSENGNYGSYTNDEVEGAIRMLQGLSDKERSYLWSTKRDSDKNNPWK